MLSETLTAILWCPSCGSGRPDLHASPSAPDAWQEGELICGHCRTVFPVHDGVPDLIPHDRMDSEEWKIWEGHLGGFAERRSIREKKPSPAQQKRWQRKWQAFVDFLDAPAGLLLDIGCGPAGVRAGLDPDRTTYVGIDPIPTPAVQEFLFARAVAEYIPFRDGAFACLVARSALDHFCDLGEFFRESARVLQPGGVMFIEQAIHGEGGLSGAVKTAVHEIKDFLDDRRTAKAARAAPKHMADFTRSDLLDAAGERFTVTATREYNPNLLAARQLFIALRRSA